MKHMVDQYKIKDFVDASRPIVIYRNLHKNCFSVMQDNRVKCHTRFVVLANCLFQVREAGRNKVRQTGRKNVHAFVVGMLWDSVHKEHWETLRITPNAVANYNPYRNETFVSRPISEAYGHEETPKPISHSAMVICNHETKGVPPSIICHDHNLTQRETQCSQSLN